MLLWEAPNSFLGSMLRLQDLHHHKQTFAIWSPVLLGIIRVRFIWRFSRWNTIYMQSPSKVARCLNGTLLISWNIFCRSPNVRVERNHGDHYSKALLFNGERHWDAERRSAGLRLHSVLLVEQESSQAPGSVVFPEHVFVNSGEVRGFGVGHTGMW